MNERFTIDTGESASLAAPDQFLRDNSSLEEVSVS